MKAKVLIGLLVMIIVGALGLSACGKSDEQKALDAVQAYADAMNKEDATAVRASMHRDNPSYFYIMQQLPGYFSLYNVKVSFDEMKYVGVTDGVATVDVVMTTVKTDQSDFKDNRITAQFKLKQQDGEWKVLDIAYDPAKDIEYLTPQP